MSVAGILDAMRSDRPLSERVVWQCLENHANGARFWTISMRQMAAELHLRAATVCEAVKALIRDGIVRAVRRPRSVTTYFMLRTYSQPADPVTDIETPPASEPQISVPDCETDAPDLNSANRHVENPPRKSPPEKEDSPLRSDFLDDLFPSGVALTPAQNDPIVQPQSEVGSDDDPEFVAFWSDYPRKDDKGHARKAWIKARRKASTAQIICGLRGYRFNESRQFVPLPATWLNGERWLAAAEVDDFDPVLRAAGLTPEDFAGPSVPLWGALLR